MRIVLVGAGKDLKELKQQVEIVIDELALSEYLELTTNNNPEYKKQLEIEMLPALCIEEESIDFKDVIFQGTIPPKKEITSMFLSIIGSDDMGEEGGCGSGSCGTCNACF